MIKFERATALDAHALTEVQTRCFDDDSRRFAGQPGGGPDGYDSVGWQVQMMQRGTYYKIDAWIPKLTHWADLARAADASIIVYGHTHIPWMTEVNGVWLINPGAIAAGSHLVRQKLQTVARLTLDENTPPAITYINLADLSPYHPAVDISAGFMAADTQESIATAELSAHRHWLFQEIYPLAPDPVLDAVRRVMFRCLDGEIAWVDIPDLCAEILSAPDIPDTAKARVRERFG